MAIMPAGNGYHITTAIDFDSFIETIVMHIDINNTITVKEVEDVFSNYFPYLRIEFYHHPHKKYRPSEEADKVESGTRIAERQAIHKQGRVDILPSTRVTEVEKSFQEDYGLFVQILKMEGEEWEQTVAMDDFTLGQLNEFSRDSSDEEIIEDYTEGLIEPEEKPDTLL